MLENFIKFIILSVVAVIVLYAFTRTPGSMKIPQLREGTSEAEVLPRFSPKPTPTVTPPPKGASLIHQTRMVAPVSVKKNEAPRNSLKFHLEDGVAVVHGDIVIGEVVTEEGQETPESGYVAMPSLKLWPSRVIPFYIQPHLQNPERVMQALELFKDTVIEFVPFSGEQDVMVFEEAQGECKSYVGRIGGKQPLWISPRCNPDDIAHEILHALGFVHEQNRTDRDSYIRMIGENIDERYISNFEMLPKELMQVSGLAPFDFESLMIYPPTMFSKNGQITMQSKVSGREIRPSRGLSRGDIERVNKAYGGR